MGCDRPIAADGTRAARRDFTRIAERNSTAAHRVMARIKRSIDLLGEFPFSGRASEVAGIRELPIVRYPTIVVYTVLEDGGEVAILRVRHTAQDPARHLD
jgi:plasmid stabilization system protein ParE